MSVNLVMPTGNGMVPSGPIANALHAIDYDTGFKRPFLDSRNRLCVTVNTGEFVWDKEKKKKVAKRRTFFAHELVNRGLMAPITNASSLSKQEWEMFDEVVLRVQRERLGAWSDMAGWASFGGFNGMGKMVLEHETISDPGEAAVDFDALSEVNSDSPVRNLEGLPLPIIHVGYGFSLRRLMASRNKGEPIDTTMIEAAARRVLEKVEDMCIGLNTGIVGFDSALGYNRTPRVYGYLNFPNRITKTDLTVPTGANASATVDDVLEMIEMASQRNCHGPFILYHSPNFEKYMDNDYILTGGNVATQTLRERLRAISKVTDVRQLDRLTVSDYANEFRLVLVQKDGATARAVTGMGMQNLMWETKGGLQTSFKTMAIMVPQIRADYNGNCGIVDAISAATGT